MTAIISEIAAGILENPRYNYWHPGKDADIIRLEAVEFAEPWFLGGPFNEKYGLVYIYHKPDAKPLQQQLDKLENDIMQGCSTTYMPYSALNTLEKAYPDATLFHWDPVAKQSYSDFDLPHIEKDILARLESNGNRSQLFANTLEGKAKMLGYLTDQELSEYITRKMESVKQCHQEIVQANLYAEHPYMVRLQGTDDASWSLSMATEQQATELVEALRTRGQDAVYELMAFTN